MLTSTEYIRRSMEMNLFWVRIMKEHAIFIEASLPPTLAHIARHAEQFKRQFSVLLSETIRFSNGLVPMETLQSGQYYTRFTEAAEQAVQHLTGVETDAGLTQAEYDIVPSGPGVLTGEAEQAVSRLNGHLLSMTAAFAQFKSDLFENQAACRIFTFVFTADLEHILHEAQRHLQILTGLQNGDESFNAGFAEFWIRHMADHAKTMRGLFDPTESALPTISPL